MAERTPIDWLNEHYEADQFHAGKHIAKRRNRALNLKNCDCINWWILLDRGDGSHFTERCPKHDWKGASKK